MKQQNRKVFNIQISVNEDILLSQRDSDEEDITEAIEKEFGWLYKSGIYLEKINNRHKKE